MRRPQPQGRLGLEEWRLLPALPCRHAKGNPDRVVRGSRNGDSYQTRLAALLKPGSQVLANGIGDSIRPCRPGKTKIWSNACQLACAVLSAAAKAADPTPHKHANRTSVVSIVVSTNERPAPSAQASRFLSELAPPISTCPHRSRRPGALAEISSFPASRRREPRW